MTPKAAVDTFIGPRFPRDLSKAQRTEMRLRAGRIMARERKALKA